MMPTVGRIVHYRLSADDADAIAKQRLMSNVHGANLAREGDVYPAQVVRVSASPDGAVVNLQVSLDGPDIYWVTSRLESTPEQFVSLNGAGRWCWPPRVTGRGE